MHLLIFLTKIKKLKLVHVSLYATAVHSLLDLPIDTWLLIVDVIRPKDYTSLKALQLDKLIAPILWGKLELYFGSEDR